MRKPVLIHDNLDDRREMVVLLDKLSPAERLRFLWWCCRRSRHGNTSPRPLPGHAGGSLQVWADLWALTGQFDLDLEIALAKLVEIVRRKR